MIPSLFCRSSFVRIPPSITKSLSAVRFKTYLSPEFKCKQMCQDNLNQPIFERLEMSKYFYEIDRKFQNEGRGSAVDVEIFCNAALSDIQNQQDETRHERLEQIEGLLRRFRQTEQASLMMPSTHHAVVRAFVGGRDTDTLMRIINNRIEFGVFPDDYSFTYLLDHFLETENFRDGARVAVAMMLQEEYRIPIASQMGLFSTYIYAKNLKDHTEPWDPQPPPVQEEPEDEVKIRVPFLESSYRDDHFDLTIREHLIGKTLAKFSANGPIEDSADGKIAKSSLELLGWTLFEKWDRVLALCQKLESASLAQECLKQAQSFAEENLSSDDSRLRCVESLSKLTSTTDLNVEAFLEEQVTSSVSTHESDYINLQTESLKKWSTDRENELDAQYKLFLRESKIRELETCKRQLSEREEELFFFDNYDKMEQEKFDKFAKWRKTWPRRTWATQIKMSHLENRNPYKNK